MYIGIGIDAKTCLRSIAIYVVADMYIINSSYYYFHSLMVLNTFIHKLENYVHNNSITNITNTKLC